MTLAVNVKGLVLSMAESKMGIVLFVSFPFGSQNKSRFSVQRNSNLSAPMVLTQVSAPLRACVNVTFPNRILHFVKFSSVVFSSWAASSAFACFALCCQLPKANVPNTAAVKIVFLFIVFYDLLN